MGFIVKKFIFKGWNDLTKIQKDKSYDLAIVFVQGYKFNNLPNMSKVFKSNIVFFFGGEGCEDYIMSHYSNFIEELQNNSSNCFSFQLITP